MPSSGPSRNDLGDVGPGPDAAVIFSTHGEGVECLLGPTAP